MKFTITHPMHSHPYNPELVTGDGIAKVAAAAEAAGIHGFGFTDHPAPTLRWTAAGGEGSADPPHPATKQNSRGPRSRAGLIAHASR